ncbi:hypothetical protein VPH35_124928 [Triticum aestivum]
MADARGDASIVDGDLMGAVTATYAVQDVGGVHSATAKLATAVAAVDVEKDVEGSASVLPELKVTVSSATVHPDAQPGEEKMEDDSVGNKRKLDFTGFKDLCDPEYSDDEEYEYESGEDVDNGNGASYTAKEEEKITTKVVASFYNCKIKKWHCPYRTTKPKSKDGRIDHLVSHVEDVAIRGDDYKIRGQHAALAKALTPLPK